MLISQKGRIVSKDELIDTVWKKAVVTDDSLSQCIADIRKALGDNGRQHLRTFPRKGYMLTVEPTLEHGSPVRSRNWAVLATLLVACLVAAWTFWPRTNALYPTVAVLAFDDLSAEPDRGYFSDAISEGVITELARFSEFETIARNSSFSFRDKAKDIREIGKILGATYILEGSQQKNGEALLVTAQLIDAKTGNHIWAETYSGEVADLFNVQGEIVRKIASTAGGQLSSYVSPQGHRGTVTAIHLNALGVEYMKSSTEEDVDRALPIFEQAVEADSASPWGDYICRRCGNKGSLLAASRTDGTASCRTRTRKLPNPLSARASFGSAWRHGSRDLKISTSDCFKPKRIKCVGRWVIRPSLYWRERTGHCGHQACHGDRPSSSRLVPLADGMGVVAG
jgi:TolB-like protein